MPEHLATMPVIDVMRLALVTSVPESHPEHATFAAFPVYGFLIHHPDGAIVVDTGIGHGHDLINSLYSHESTRLIDEIHRYGVDERDVRLVANSHLHFDHCGQNRDLTCPIAVQRAEIDAAQEPFYTVPEWAHVPANRALLLDGDSELATGVTALLTPGHTPGHQAIVIRTRDEVVIIAAQCVFRRGAWDSEPELSNLHGDSWQQAAADSLRRLRALRPSRVLLSHDSPVHFSG